MTDIEELVAFKEQSHLLVMNSWRHEIPRVQRNIILANALNHCIVHKNLNLIGYLITNTRLFIIGASETTPFQGILHYLYLRVETEIANYKKMMNEYDDEYHLAHHVHHKLFVAYPFHNQHIKDLITGKKVTLNYYDPNVARLKDYIHNHTYCSALDYAGGKSPVIVTTKKEK